VQAPIAAELSVADYSKRWANAITKPAMPVAVQSHMCIDELARISSRMFRAASRAFPNTRRFVTDNLKLNVDAPSATLRKQASGFRQLAGESLDEGFRGRVLELAQDYERQAESLEDVNLP
jgi:hypothetical protein